MKRPYPSLIRVFAIGTLFAATGFSETRGSSRGLPLVGLCTGSAAVANIPSSYYAIELVPTKRVSGTGGSKGVGVVQFRPSPFGVSTNSQGNYLYDIALSVERIKPPKKGVYAAWVASSDLKSVRSLGALSEDFRASGSVEWNKFLVIVTLEPSEELLGERWRGPVVMRGMSRSGLMHTLAGHGPFENEPCNKYGYD